MGINDKCFLFVLDVILIVLRQRTINYMFRGQAGQIKLRISHKNT